LAAYSVVGTRRLVHRRQPPEGGGRTLTRRARLEEEVGRAYPLHVLDEEL